MPKNKENDYIYNADIKEWVESGLGFTRLLSDYEIQKYCEEMSMISPFKIGKQKKNDKGEKIVSYGLSEYGYDVRLGSKIKVPLQRTSENKPIMLDPKNPNENHWEVIDLDKPFILKGNSMILVETVERFKMPYNVVALVMAKSTYSRLGVMTPHAVFEPDWEGVPSMALMNKGENSVLIHPNEGFAQVMFFSAQQPNAGYEDGKYQNQSGVAIPKV